jgi:hypothetical protein
MSEAQASSQALRQFQRKLSRNKNPKFEKYKRIFAPQGHILAVDTAQLCRTLI